MAFHSLEVDYLKINKGVNLPPSLQGTHVVSLGKYDGDAFVTTIPYTQNPAGGGSTTELPIGFTKDENVVTLYVPWFTAQGLDGAQRSLRLEPPLPANLRPTTNTWTNLILGFAAGGNGEGLETAPRAPDNGKSIVLSVDTSGIIRLAAIDVGSNPPTLNSTLNLQNPGDYGFGPTNLTYYQY
jgi:hypothetical protein